MLERGGVETSAERLSTRKHSESFKSVVVLGFPAAPEDGVRNARAFVVSQGNAQRGLWDKCRGLPGLKWAHPGPLPEAFKAQAPAPAAGE